MRRLSAHTYLIACLAVLPTSARISAQEPSVTPDISGFWELAFDSRSVPRASLLPTITRARIDARAKKDAYAVRWCNLLGVPFVMDPGRPLDIRQGASAIIIVPENSSAPRYLYTNRSAHISEDVFDPSTNGDSIAHWEGDTLIVDTIGFHGDRGITAIPGGGYRTDKSRLVERYRLLKEGSILSVTFTWTDPVVFRRAHSYAFRYYKVPSISEPRVVNVLVSPRARSSGTRPEPEWSGVTGSPPVRRRAG